MVSRRNGLTDLYETCNRQLVSRKNIQAFYSDTTRAKVQVEASKISYTEYDVNKIVRYIFDFLKAFDITLILKTHQLQLLTGQYCQQVVGSRQIVPVQRLASD